MIDPKYGKGLKITSGKAEYIKKRNEKGGYDDICLCDYNIDLSPGCISNTHCGTKKRSATRHNCTYCYARRTNYHEAKPYAHDKSILKGIENDIIENKIKYIRLGKKVECGNKENRSLLLKILEIGGKHDVQFIFPTKYLEFNKIVGKLLKETNSVVGFSIGADIYEDGACSYGCNNKFRLNQAKKYLDYGINTTLKIVTDVTVCPEEAQRSGWFAWKAFKEFPGDRIEILPVRIKAKKFAHDATGESWDMLQSPKQGENFFDFMNVKRDRPRYVMEQDITVLIANYFNEYYDDIIKRRQICGHIGSPENGTVFCDMCHITDCKGRKLKAKSFPMSLLPPSPGAKNGRSGSGRKWYDANNWGKISADRNDKKYQKKLDLK
jgi:hypothetical protein